MRVPALLFVIALCILILGLGLPAAGSKPADTPATTTVPLLVAAAVERPMPRIPPEPLIDYDEVARIRSRILSDQHREDLRWLHEFRQVEYDRETEYLQRKSKWLLQENEQIAQRQQLEAQRKTLKRLSSTAMKQECELIKLNGRIDTLPKPLPPPDLSNLVTKPQLAKKLATKNGRFSPHHSVPGADEYFVTDDWFAFEVTDEKGIHSDPHWPHLYRYLRGGKLEVQVKLADQPRNEQGDYPTQWKPVLTDDIGKLYYRGFSYPSRTRAPILVPEGFPDYQSWLFVP